MNATTVSKANVRQRSAPARQGRAIPPSRGSFSPLDALTEVLRGVEWTPSLLAFLYYYFVVVTYYFPGADIAMVASVCLLAFQLDTLRVGRVLSIAALRVGWAWMSFLASSEKTVSFEATWNMTKLWIVCFVAFNVLRTRAQLRFFFAFATACFVFFPARGTLVNFLVGNTTFGRAVWNNAYSNPNDLAAYALLFGSIALALLFVSRNRLTRAFSALTVSIVLILIFFTQSRGALLATGVVAAIVLVTRVRNLRVTLYTVAAIVVAGFFAPQGAWDRIGGLSKVSFDSGMRGVDAEGSAEQRFQIAKIAARVARDHPLLGVGAGAYETVHYEYSRRFAGELPLAVGRRDAHNTYLHAAAEQGVAGLLIFLALCLSTVARARATLRRGSSSGAEATRYLTYGLVGFLIAGLFGSLEYINLLLIHLVIIEGTILCVDESKLPEMVSSSSSRRRRSSRAV
jgi:O-antigen ligase